VRQKPLLDIACWDILGKSIGMPIYSFPLWTTTPTWTFFWLPMLGSGKRQNGRSGRAGSRYGDRSILSGWTDIDGQV